MNRLLGLVHFYFRLNSITGRVIYTVMHHSNFLSLGYVMCITVSID